jgi:hypothetical protein
LCAMTPHFFFFVRNLFLCSRWSFRK